MISLSTVELVAIVAASIVVGGGIGSFVGWWYRGHSDDPDEFEATLDENVADDGHTVTLPAPEVKGSLWSLFKFIRHRRKEKKLAKRGYVRWYKFDGMLSSPKWVKPKKSGSGIPKYNDGDAHYLFPKDALVTDSRTGAPVAIHHKGEAEPVNLANPAHPPIDADRLDEVINLEIDSDPPSWLSKFDLNATTMMWILILIVMGVAAAQQFL